MAEIEQYDLLRVLSDHLHARPSQVQVTPELLACAKKHQVSGILYYQTKVPALQKDYFSMLYLYKNRQKLEEEIGGLLETDGMRYLWVKGMEVAVMYPIPALRSMGDSDVLVENIERACELLTANGYYFGHHDQCEWPCYKNSLRIELQSRLAYTGSEKALIFFNQTCWQHEKDHHLDWSFHFIYLLEHLKKHLTTEGVGFRQFMDLAVVMQKVPDQLDWPWMQEQLTRLGLWKFTEMCLGLVRRWFEVELPVEVPDIGEEFFTFATGRIMEYGVFGFDYHPNEGADATAPEKTTGGRSPGERLKAVLGKLFPSYEQLIVWNEYRFLKGRRYLLPACWVYRWVRNATRKENWRRLFFKSDAEKQKDARKNAELEQWGL